MTFGFTGVVWGARTAEINSTLLNAGTHAVSMQAAVPAWSALAAEWQSATTIIAGVMAQLGIGMEGVNGLGAVARLGGFAAWTEQQALMAASIAAEAEANAVAYTVASMVMPTLPEIVALDTAKTAAYAHGGVIDGTAEAAEAAWIAMQVRASAVMEVYEAACSAIIMTPTDFAMAPPIANDAGDVASFLGATGNVVTDTIQAAAMGGPGAVSAAMNSLGTVSGTAVTAASTTASTITEAGLEAATASGSNGLMTGVVAGAPLGVGAGAALGAAGLLGSLGSVGYSPNFGANSSVKIPAGWGNEGLGALPVSGSTNAALTENERPSARPTNVNTTVSQQAHKSNNDDDDEHETPDYLKNFEHFADGRTVAPAVIGVTVEADNR